MDTKISRFKGHWCPMARMVCPGSNNPEAGKRKWCPDWLEVMTYDEKGNALGRESECGKQKVPAMLAKLEVDILRASKLANESRNLAETGPVRLIQAIEQRRLRS